MLFRRERESTSEAYDEPTGLIRGFCRIPLLCCSWVLLPGEVCRGELIIIPRTELHYFVAAAGCVCKWCHVPDVEWRIYWIDGE